VLADDDVLLREGLASLLDRSGFDVLGQAGNGPELLALVRSVQPELAIIDIRMPPSQATEGLQAARVIREELPGTAIIVLSAHVEVDEAMELLAGGQENGPIPDWGRSVRPRHIAPVALVLGLIVVAFLGTRLLGERDARQDSEHRAEVAAAQIRARVEQGSSLAESLSRFMASVAGSPDASQEFASTASRWLSPADFPAAAWIEQVPGPQRVAYERRTGNPIVTIDRQLRIVPAGSRSSYLPATLVSGIPPMETPGIDLGGESGVAAAVTRASALDEVRATPLTTLRDEQTEAEALSLVEGKTMLAFENRLVCKDGSYRWIEWTATPVPKEGVLYGVGRDVTERRQAESELRRLAREQAARRRVATLVATGVSPAEVFSAVAEEVERLLDAQATAIGQLEPDGTMAIVASSGTARDELPVGSRLKLESELALTTVVRTGRSARIDGYGRASESVHRRAERLGIRGTVAVPIMVEGSLWGSTCESSCPGSRPG